MYIRHLGVFFYLLSCKTILHLKFIIVFILITSVTVALTIVHIITISKLFIICAVITAIMIINSLNIVPAHW